MRMRWGTRFTTVLAVSLAPLVSGPVAAPPVVHTAGPVRAAARPAAQPAADVSVAPLTAGTPTDPRAQAIFAADANVVEPPQPVAPRITIEGRISRSDKGKVKIAGPRGTRVWTASALLDHDLPAAALAAYKRAAASMARTDPSCRLPWTLLAGIGRVESDHGRYGGSVLGSDGLPRPAIIGVALNGAGPVAAIHDTDNGRFDGDRVWDRAVGPMQFIPSTWASAGRDGDGNGVANPNDLDDAALAAAGYLCSGSGSVLPEAAMKAAIFRYNPSDYYVALVMAFERGYRTGVFVIPSPPAPAQAEATHPGKPHRPHADKPKAKHTKASAKPAKHATTTKPKAGAQQQPAAKPKPKPSPKPSGSSSSSPKPSPKPSPSQPSSPPPSTPELAGLSGQLAACGAGWCVGDVTLDLGPDSQLAATAANDFDGDGATESNAGELAGLVGTTVDLQVQQGSAPAVVYLINGKGYRNADGSFTQ